MTGGLGPRLLRFFFSGTSKRTTTHDLAFSWGKKKRPKNQCQEHFLKEWKWCTEAVSIFTFFDHNWLKFLRFTVNWCRGTRRAHSIQNFCGKNKWSDLDCLKHVKKKAILYKLAFSLHQLTIKVTQILRHKSLICAVGVVTSFTDARAVRWTGWCVAALWSTWTRRFCLHLQEHWRWRWLVCFLKGGVVSFILKIFKDWQVWHLVGINI